MSTESIYHGEPLRAAELYIPRLKKSVPVILDHYGKAIGFGYDGLFSPLHGMAAAQSIAVNRNIANRAKYYQFEVAVIDGQLTYVDRLPAKIY